MRINSKFLRSNKLIRFLVIFLFFSLLLIIFLKPLSPKSEIRVSISCLKTEITEKYCLFNCTVKSNEDAVSRIIVTHTVWASIFDKEFDIKNDQTLFIDIKLPKRLYVYYLRAGLYNEKHYGTFEGELLC